MEDWEEPHPGRRFHLPDSAGQAGNSRPNIPFCESAASYSTTEFQQPCHNRPCPLLGHLRSHHLYRRRPSPGAFVGRGGFRPCDAPSLHRPGSSVESVPSTVRMEEAADCEWNEMGAISRSISEGEGTATNSPKPSSSIETNPFCNESERVVQREFDVKEGNRSAAVWECANPYNDVHGWEAEFERRLHMGSLEAKRPRKCKLPIRRSLWRRVSNQRC